MGEVQGEESQVDEDSAESRASLAMVREAGQDEFATSVP
jgi:hypothetical protein